MSSPVTVVKNDRRTAFEQDGFVTGIRVLDTAGSDRLREEFNTLEAVEGREKCQIGLMDRHFDVRFIWEMATHPAILDAVESVMGPDILLLATHFFCKYPAAEAPDSPHVKAGSPGHLPVDVRERFVAWHQDVTYWGLDPAFALTAWYAVDDADAENGCMRVIPGTHHAIREHGVANRPGNLLSINQEVPVKPEEENSAVDLCLKAGEISLHHGALIHGSNPNLSNRRRCGMTVRFVPPYVRVVGENSVNRPWQAVLVRGEDPFGYHGSRPRPF